MRWLLAAVLLLAGCASPSTTDEAAGPDAPTAPTSDSNASAPAAPVQERMPVGTESFVLMPDHSLAVLPQDGSPLAETTLAEPLRSTSLYESFATPLDFVPWEGPESRSAWESTADIDITLKFKVSAPATSATPRAAGFPGVGGWLGTADRYQFFVLATDAPDTLEANKVYTVHLVAKPPQGGFFLREGERMALHTFLTYQVADGSAPSYVLGGDEPSGFALVHEHFNLTAPRATVVLDTAGEIDPNAGPSGDMQQKPVDVPFTVPADALYIVVEGSATPKAGTRVDFDVGVRTPSGEAIASGSSPHAQESVVLGPANLAAYGRELVAHLTNAGNPSGATWTLKVTAYSP